MKDSVTTLEELKACVADFVARREWQKYHRPKDLAMALSVEALRPIAWTTPASLDRKERATDHKPEISCPTMGGRYGVPSPGERGPVR